MQPDPVQKPSAGIRRVLVTVIIPVLDERSTIASAVRAGLAQHLEGAGLEVVAVDGGSRDGSRQMLDALAARDPRVRVLDNPAGGTPQALNIGLAAARGEYWLRLDGHSRVPDDYVRRLLTHLDDGRAEAAGGIVHGVGAGAFGRAAAAVQDSRFGVGNARHHYATRTTYVDHLSHGLYRVDRSRAIGGFDESLVRNQDFDFDFRYGLGGGRILLDATITFERLVRGSVTGLARQFHQYGYWKYVVLRRHPRSFHLRWLAPPALIVGLTTGICLSPTKAGRRLFAVVGGSYVGTVIATAAALGDRMSRPSLRGCAMVTMHLAWGSGFLRAALAGAHRTARPSVPRSTEPISSDGVAEKSAQLRAGPPQVELLLDRPYGLPRQPSAQLDVVEESR